MASGFGEAENLAIKVDGFFEIRDAVAGMKEASEHRKFQVLDFRFSI